MTGHEHHLGAGGLNFGLPREILGDGTTDEAVAAAVEAGAIRDCEPVRWRGGLVPCSGAAVLDEAGLYRYALLRIWDAAAPTVCFIGLNPSTADAQVNDPTLRRCIGFASLWGYGSLSLVNLFAYRATDPKAMLAAADPIGPQCNEILEHEAREAARVVCAWGMHGLHLARGRWVVQRLQALGLGDKLQCLGVTTCGQPRHPLYLKGDTALQPYPDPATPVGRGRGRNGRMRRDEVWDAGALEIATPEAPTYRGEPLP